MPSFAVHTLGCKVNQYETELITNDLLNYGLALVDFSDSADVYIVNTCTVTERSDHKCRQWIARAKRRNPEAVVAVTGCFAQRAKGQLTEIEGVSLVLGNESKKELASQVCKILNIEKSAGRPAPRRQHFHTRALIKVQDGCNNYCSFCIVPYVRGEPRSRALDEIASEISELSLSGVREFVLTGINLGKYGQDLEQGIEMTDLLRAVERTPQPARFRLSSIEVKAITPRLIEFLSKNGRFCRHLHIPLQSGDNDILRSMNRDYTVEKYFEIVGEIRRQIPSLALTTDVMVGFPGETSAQLENTKSAVEKMGFGKIHVFKYSDREGTKAFGLGDKVSPEIKEKRSSELIELGRRSAIAYLEALVGKTVQVLVEKTDEAGRAWGIMDNYAKIGFPAPAGVRGELLDVLVEQREGLKLRGKIAG